MGFGSGVEKCAPTICDLGDRGLCDEWLNGAFVKSSGDEVEVVGEVVWCAHVHLLIYAERM